MPREEGRAGGAWGRWKGGHKPPPRLTSSGSLTTVITLPHHSAESGSGSGPAPRLGVPRDPRAAGHLHVREGGGEMDTTSYDVSVLNSSARHGGGQAPAAGRAAVPLRSRCRSHPGKRPGACAREMAAMIGVKKEEADHDGRRPAL